MSSRTAFSPGSVTCFFLPSPGRSAEETVSRGCAIDIDAGVTAAVEPRRADAGSAAGAASEVLWNGQPIVMPAVRQVIDRLAPMPVRVDLQSPLPVGCGFGLSAAGALAAAFAIARRFDLAEPRAELGRIAHVADVTSRTGIGDVGAQLCGGVVYRRCAEGPLDCVRLSVPAVPLWYRAFGDLPTADVLGCEATMRRIRTEGARAVAWLRERVEAGAPPGVPELLDRGLQFAEAVGLVTHDAVRRSIRRVRERGGHATMILLGHSVLATLPPDEDGAAWRPCSIDLEGTRWLP